MSKNIEKETTTQKLDEIVAQKQEQEEKTQTIKEIQEEDQRKR